jgi:hypothetical protein
MPKTGNKATAPGIYRSSCCRHECTQGTGNKFPPCGKCQGAANWKLVRETNKPKAPRKAATKSKGFWESLFG